ncbi:MAG: exodeoxyribonuclease VII small subunit, partial [Lachnospiraceae bacterium]|nr:exodeoxyribonuclease VII small subunit [Lachnospiraceae bacterium]
MEKKEKTKDENKDVKIEDKYKEIEEILNNMNSDDITLEESFALYKSGLLKL